MESMPVDVVETPSLADDPALGLERRTKLEILGAVLLGLFLGALDQTIVGPALPKIVTDLQRNLGGVDYYTWVVTIYLLTSTITIPFYGKLSDIYGRKPLLMAGISIFLVGSALSGLSQEMWQLILFRGIQGVGAGALFPISLAVIGDLFTPAERGKYQGLFGAVFGISFLVGPLIGGTLTDQVSWHWIFYVNIPVGAISLYVIWRLLPNVRHPEKTHSLDFLGAGVFAVAVGLLLVGLTNVQTLPWTAFETGGFVAIAAVLGVLFVAVEARAKEPIVPLDLWRNRTYSASIVSTFLVSFAFFAAIIFLPRWFQIVRGSSATESGYQLFPLLIGLIGSSIISGQLISRTGRYKALIVGSIVLTTVGILLMTNLTTNVDLPILWFWMFVTGLGLGPTLAGFTIIVQNAVPFDKLGVATSNLTFFRQIGGAIGLAVTGTLFGTRLSEALPGQLAANGVPQPIVDQFTAAGGGLGNELTGVTADLGASILAGIPEPFKATVAPFIPNIVAGIHDAFTAAIASTFWVGVVTAGLGIVAAVAIHELPLRTTHGPATAPARPSSGVGAGEALDETLGEAPGETGIGRPIAETPSLD